MANTAAPIAPPTKAIRVSTALADELNEIARLTGATPAEIIDRLVNRAAVQDLLETARAEELSRLKKLTKSK